MDDYLSLLHPNSEPSVQELLSRIGALETSDQKLALRGGSAVTYDSSGKISSLNATYITGQVVNAQIANIDWAKIINVSVGTADIENAAITQAKIALLAVETGQIEDAAITNAKIANLAVDTAKIANAAITNAKINDLSADKITAGTISVGGTSQPGYIYIKRGGSQASNDAYLRWEGGSQLWSDSNNYLGLKSTGERIYFYTGTTLFALFQRSSQATFYSGVDTGGNLNVSSGDARINSGKLRVNTGSSPSETLYVEGSGKFVGNLASNHHDPRSSNSYNLGGSSQYWAYLNVYDISKQGGGGFGVYDTGVPMQDGRILPDTEALLEMKPHATLKTKYGKPIYDMETIPLDVRIIPKVSNRGNPIVKHTEGEHAGKYIEEYEEEIEFKEGKFRKEKKLAEHTEGESVFAMMSIMMGAIRELTVRTKDLEELNGIAEPRRTPDQPKPVVDTNLTKVSKPDKLIS